jgi:hypothetical protein
MKKRHYLIPSRGYQVLHLALSEEGIEWLGEARRRLLALMKQEPELTAMTYSGLERFATASIIEDLSGDDDLREALYDDNSVVLLAAPADFPMTEVHLSGFDAVQVVKYGVKLSAVRSDWRLVSWQELGVDADEDLLRCRYADCDEAHPVATENELTTCLRCRKDMGIE